MIDLPQDLVPLPTMPYEERPSELPLDIEECRTALWLNRGNISNAAAMLKVAPARLRKFVANSPRLSEETKEAQQQLVDIAEDNVYDALVDPEDKARRDTMSRFVIQQLGGDRGYGNKAGPGVNINLPKGKVSIQWQDGSSLNVDTSNEKVIEHE